MQERHVNQCTPLCDIVSVVLGCPWKTQKYFLKGNRIFLQSIKCRTLCSIFFSFYWLSSCIIFLIPQWISPPAFSSLCNTYISSRHVLIYMKYHNIPIYYIVWLLLLSVEETETVCKFGSFRPLLVSKLHSSISNWHKSNWTFIITISILFLLNHHKKPWN